MPTQSPQKPDELLTPQEVAKILKVDEHTLYRWRQKKKYLAFYQIGDNAKRPMIRYRRSEVLNLLSSARIEPEE